MQALIEQLYFPSGYISLPFVLLAHFFSFRNYTLSSAVLLLSSWNDGLRITLYVLFAPLQKIAFLMYHQIYCCISGGGQHHLMQLLPSSLFRLNHINLLQDHYKAIHGCLCTQKSHLPANWMDEWRGNYNFLLWNHRPLPLEQQENFH